MADTNTTATADAASNNEKKVLKEFAFCVQVVESQRRYVLTGWTGRARFPIDPYEWSDVKGQCSRPTREIDFELPKCPPYPCEWAGDWEIYLGTDECDWYAGGGSGPHSKNSKPNSRNGSPSGKKAGDSSNNFNKANSTDEVAGGGVSDCKYTRFDDDGWEYAFDYHRTFRSRQSSTMSWVRRRFWRRIFVVRAPSVEDVEEEVPFPDRFHICMLESGPIDRAAHRAAVEDYLVYRPQPRVSDYKVGLRRIGLKLYRPADGDKVPRSRSKSADKERKEEEEK